MENMNNKKKSGEKLSELDFKLKYNTELLRIKNLR